MIYIYKIVSPSNKVYIGITNNWYKRWNDHINLSKSKKYPIHKAINKYTPENMLWTVIDTATDYNTAYELERRYILQFDSYNLGYNSTIGGDGASKWTKDLLLLEAQKYTRKIDFKKNNQSAYVILNSYKKVDIAFFNKCTSHFVAKSKKYKTKWSTDKVIKESSKYTNLKDVHLHDKSLYAAIGRIRRNNSNRYKEITVNFIKDV